MSEYTAPLADMQFVLEELAGLDSVSKLPGCEEVTSELLGQILEEASRFASGVLARTLSSRSDSPIPRRSGPGPCAAHR